MTIQVFAIFLRSTCYAIKTLARTIHGFNGRFGRVAKPGVYETVITFLADEAAGGR